MNTKSRYEFTVKRPVAIFMIVLGIFVFGLVSYKRLSWDLMPEISYPSFTVRTEYPGAAPEEVENVVSRPLEEQLSLIKDLVSITSVSRAEQSDVILEFNWDANLDRASQEIREKLDRVFLDPAVKRPMILRYDPSLDPVLRIGIVSDIPLIDLRVMVEDEIARDLESLPGVAAAKVKGGFEKEILIKLDEKQIAASGIRFDQVTMRLAQENINLAGGNIKEGETEYIVRTLNEFGTIKEIGDIIIAKREDVMVRLKDIASITYSHKERKVITRVNQRESIEIDIYKEADANIVDVSERVKERFFGTVEQQEFVKNLREKQAKAAAEGKEYKSEGNPLEEKRLTDFLEYSMSLQGQAIEYHILADQSVFIENSISEVRSTAVMGGILAIIVLYLFLLHFGTTLIVAVSIPLSVVAAFAPLDFFNVSLNIMSLGGLALGIGMLVDNSIVVMESIFRCREEGDDWVQSAVRGVSEVGGAVFASTLTTVAVFFPIVFVEGIAGQIFGDFSLAVVFSLLASLLVSLYFIPMLASRRYEFSGEKAKVVKSFTFRFDSKRSFINYLLLPLEVVKDLGLLVLNLLVVFLMMVICSAVVLFYPILAWLKRHGMVVQWIENFSVNYPIKKTIWEKFVYIFPFKYYIDSMGVRKFFLIWPLAWLYYIFRFMFTGILFLFSRVLMSFVAGLIIVGRGILIMVLALIAPLSRLIAWVSRKFLDWLYQFYARLLGGALKHSQEIIIATSLLFVFSIFVILPRLGSELLPEVHQGTLYVNITFPVGTPVERNDSVLQQINEKIKGIAAVKSVSYYSGTTREELQEDDIGEHIARVTIILKPARDIQVAEDGVIGRIRELMSGFTDIDYNISRPVLFTMKSPIEVVLKGYNLEQLRMVSLALYEKIGQIEGLKDVQCTTRPGFPELVIEFDRMRLSHYGLNAYDVASLIKNKIEGAVPTKYKEKDRRVDIRVYLKDDQRQRAENIKRLIVNPGGVIAIPLESVANVSIMSGPNEIRRVDQDRSAVISANIADISLTEAVGRIYRVVESYPMPQGITFEMSGQNKEMETSLSSLTLALVLSIFLVYIVMASQFESFVHPFLIMFTIPMALIGVLITLYVLNIPLGVTVYIGIITLVGVVVNNAIILIDYINTLRKRGMEKLEAIKQAGSVRLRPILMTTLTTVLGLVPMALGLGEGTEIRMPMAVTIIAGLTSATFLTLILIPVVYNKFSK